MATVTRPTAGYSPTNPITNSTKYQLDSAATAPRVSISSVKVDGDLNKAFDVLSDHDNSIVDHESRIDTLEGAAEPVTSVGLSMPAEFSVANSPVTSTGTLTVTKATQTANQVYAGPATGSAAAPGFRTLVAADLVVGSDSQSGIIQLADASTTKTATDTAKPAAVGTLINHPGIAKAWASFTGSTGAVLQSYGITSITRNSAGRYTVVMATALADANYVVTTGFKSGTNLDIVYLPNGGTKTTTTFQINSDTSPGGAQDAQQIFFAVHGNAA